MKNTTKIMVAVLALGASAWFITAQDAGNQAPADNQGPRPRRFQGPPQGGSGDQVQQNQDGPGFPHHRPPFPPPLLGVLDANHDGVIDASEIANASAALLTLDKNGDGQLTPDEFAPPRPPGGPGGPHGFGPGANGGAPRGPRPPQGQDQPAPDQDK